MKSLLIRTAVSFHLSALIKTVILVQANHDIFNSSGDTNDGINNKNSRTTSSSLASSSLSSHSLRATTPSPHASTDPDPFAPKSEPTNAKALFDINNANYSSDYNHAHSQQTPAESSKFSIMMQQRSMRAAFMVATVLVLFSIILLVASSVITKPAISFILVKAPDASCAETTSTVATNYSLDDHDDDNDGDNDGDIGDDNGDDDLSSSSSSRKRIKSILSIGSCNDDSTIILLDDDHDSFMDQTTTELPDNLGNCNTTRHSNFSSGSFGGRRQLWQFSSLNTALYRLDSDRHVPPVVESEEYAHGCCFQEPFITTKTPCATIATTAATASQLWQSFAFFSCFGGDGNDIVSDSDDRESISAITTTTDDNEVPSHDEKHRLQTSLWQSSLVHHGFNVEDMESIIPAETEDASS